MNHALYLTRNGLLEPLGQSQVLSYLRGLSQEYRFTIVSYEKAEDWADSRRVAKLWEECERLGINWLPQRFRAQPKLVAPAISMIRMIWLVAREVQQRQIRVIHSRSYIPAAVALLVGRVLGVPFIFDMRALWPEELITAGRLRRGSLLHRAIVQTEKVCLRRAAGVVSLTDAAAAYLRRVYPDQLSGQTVAVIPTCADLDRFSPAKQPPTERVIGCLGTVLSGWFRLDWLAAFLTVGSQRDPSLRFELTTRDDSARVRALIGGDADLQSRLRVETCSSEQVPTVLRGQIASVMFYAGGEISELGRSPTRMAEILGCGLPVVANDGVGDVAKIIRKYRVGVLVSGPSKAEMNAGWDDLLSLLDDPDLPLRCRRAAEAIFSLQAGTTAYSALYRRILDSANEAKASPP